MLCSMLHWQYVLCFHGTLCRSMLLSMLGSVLSFSTLYGILHSVLIVWIHVYYGGMDKLWWYGYYHTTIGGALCCFLLYASLYTVVLYCVSQCSHALYGPSCTVAFAVLSLIWTTLRYALWVKNSHVFFVSRLDCFSSIIWPILFCL